jgi:hypothetical protein
MNDRGHPTKPVALLDDIRIVNFYLPFQKSPKTNLKLEGLISK